MDLTYYSTEETLNAILEVVEKQEKGVYLRFGDGDINLASGVSELYQKSNLELTKLMKDAINLRDKNVIKTLPLHNKEWDTLEEGMFPGNHECDVEWCENIIHSFYNVSDTNETEFYSTVALSHQATQNPEKAISFLKEIGSRVKYFIGNEDIPEDLIKTIFNDSVVHIKTPSQNSFSEFDRIYTDFVEKVADDTDYSVVVTSMGCTGRAMQKKIWDKYDNFFLFDFGSLMDALCGWDTRAWIELTNFDKDEFLGKLK
jgi:hypothetical protein